VLTNHEKTFDIMVNVIGGGESGQAGAVRRQHHAGADRLRRAAEADAVEGRLVHARRARSRAKKVGLHKGAAAQFSKR
jgi:small subunit ribosomal protein S9